MYSKKFFLFFLSLHTFSFAIETDIGQINTHLELFHYNIILNTESQAQDSKATVLGGFMKYTSKPYYHFGVAVKQYSSLLIFNAHNPSQTSLTDSAGHDINPLAELYLYYKDHTLHIKAGKQQLKTPLINDDTTRLIPFSYYGVTSQINVDNKSYLSFGYISEFRANNSEAYTKYSSSGLAQNGVTYLGFNTKFGDVAHQWYYYHAPDLYDAYHMQVDTKTKYDEFKDLIYGIQAIYTTNNSGGENITNRTNGGSNVKLISAKLGLDSEKFLYVGSLSYNFGKDGINRGYGGLSSLYTTSMITSGKQDGNPFAKSLKIRYKYYSPSKDKEYSSSIHLTNVTYQDNTKNSINALYVDHHFKFRPREYLLLRFENQWIAGENDKSYFRIISAYEF